MFNLGTTRMILYPAIDLKDGKCVRLQRGLMERATVFTLSPADQAREFASQGFPALHVVDLNGAFEGRSVNTDAVSAILASVSIPVQLGGGIRDIEAIATWLKRGVARLILGTAAVRNPDLVKQACARFPGKIADPHHYFACTICVSDNSLNCVRCFFQIWRVTRKPAQGSLPVGDYPSERLIDFVSN